MILAGSERVLEWESIPPLQCYGHLLEQVGSLSLVANDACRSSSDLLDQFNGFLVSGSHFDDHWVKYVGAGQFLLLLLVAASSAAARFHGWVD